MADIKDVYRTAMGGYQAALIEEQANYQKAALTGDFDEQVRSSQSMASLRAAMGEYDRMAGEYTASQRAAPAGNAHGLSPDEAEIAKVSGLTEEQYKANKQKMLAMKDEGYWSQGKVFK